MPSWVRRDGNALILLLRVHPRAGRDEVIGPRADRLRVRVAAAPADGAANAGLVRLLAAEFGVPRARVSLVSGAGSRDKRVSIEAPRRLPAWLPPDVAGESENLSGGI